MQPAMFIPLGDIRSVELARATGASSTFDMYVHCRDGTTTEFSNLSRNEIGAIEAWVRATSVGVGPASDDEEEGQSSGGDDGGSDSSDADDEDFNPEAEAKAEARDATGRAKKRRKLAAVSNGDEGGEGAKAVIGAEEGGLEGDSASEGDASSSDSDENSESDSDSDDSGSVELVSEDEFSVGQLKSMMEEEAQGKGALQ